MLRCARYKLLSKTFALYEREKQRNNPVYDLGDSPDHWQNYNGVINETPSTYAAVDRTDKQVLTYKDSIILSVFHDCSGEHTENVEDV